MRYGNFNRTPADLRRSIVMGAGMFVDSFDPETREVGNVITATNGGANFTATPNYIDFGDGIDNVPANAMELKEIDDWTVTISGTARTVSNEAVRRRLGAADVDSDDESHIVPRNYLELSDFNDLWWIGPVGRVNGSAASYFLAIHLMNVLSTGGFQMQSNDKDKGDFAFEYTAHYTLEDPDLVPFDIWVQRAPAGAKEKPQITLTRHTLQMNALTTAKLAVAQLIPSDAAVAWTSSDTAVASVENGTISGLTAGSAIVTASITVDGVTYNDTCTVIVD